MSEQPPINVERVANVLRELRDECSRLGGVVVKISGDLDEQARAHAIASKQLFDTWRCLKDIEQRAREEAVSISLPPVKPRRR